MNSMSDYLVLPTLQVGLVLNELICQCRRTVNTHILALKDREQKEQTPASSVCVESLPSKEMFVLSGIC